MGQARRRRTGIGECIYCGSCNSLSDEHVLPYALGGNLVLQKASCESCRVITGRLEQKLLRGHWWPYRKMLGLQTRNPDASKELKPVRIIKSNGDTIDGQMPLESFVYAIELEFSPPTILEGIKTSGKPFAKQATMRTLGPAPTMAIVDGNRIFLSSNDKVDFPVNFSSEDLTRFLAKVAHGFAISKEGLSEFGDLYLPKYILGETDGIQTYVGGYASPLIISVLQGGGYNRMQIRKRNNFISVCIQLFVNKGEPPPIYEVVVGTKRCSE